MGGIDDGLGILYTNGHVRDLPLALMPLYNLPEAREVLMMVLDCNRWGPREFLLRVDGPGQRQPY